MSELDDKVAAALAQAKTEGLSNVQGVPVATEEPEGSLKISNLMYDWARDLPEKVINSVSPSQVGGCMRKHWYAIHHAPTTTPTNPGAIINMQTGFMWEDIITKSLQHAGIPFMSQLHVKSAKYNMQGTIDYVILVKRDGEWEAEVWDSKTESSLAYKYRNGSYLNSHEEYVDQLNSYAIMLRDLGFTVRRGGFIVVRRDDSFVENHPFMFDELRIAKTESRIKELEAHLANNTLPECDGKFCKLGLCNYGNPETQKENAKGKLVNTECCPAPRVLKSWADKLEEATV